MDMGAENKHLYTADVTRTILAVAKRIEADGNVLLDLQIRRPSLEDVFLELTGRAWAAGGQK